MNIWQTSTLSQLEDGNSLVERALSVLVHRFDRRMSSDSLPVLQQQLPQAEAEEEIDGRSTLVSDRHFAILEAKAAVDDAALTRSEAPNSAVSSENEDGDNEEDIQDEVDEEYRLLPLEKARSKSVKPAAKKKSAKKKIVKKKAASAKPSRSLIHKAKSFVPPSASCLLPTDKDPMDETFCRKLYVPEDDGRLNLAHVHFREHGLEVRRTVSGKVFFRCAYCEGNTKKPEDEGKADNKAPDASDGGPDSKRPVLLSTIAPRKVETIYRSFIRFMSLHVKVHCRSIPPAVRALDSKDRVGMTVRVKNVRQYWTDMANRMGLVNGDDCIVYDPAAAAMMAD